MFAMKHYLNLKTLRPYLLGVAIAAATASTATPVQSKPFVDFATAPGDHIGVAGFPALEVLPGEKNMAMIVARESPVQGNITYSSGYFSPTSKFTRPAFVSFTLYGYHNLPKWKEIKSVTLKFGAQTYSAKPLYSMQGPDRDRSQDAQNSDYFEVMTVTIPTAVAQQISKNNGVVVTTLPTSFYLPIAASKMHRFKQLVGSIEAIAKREAVKNQTSSKRPTASKAGNTSSARLGLPITEVFDDSTGGTMLETAIAPISRNFAIQGMAWTEEQGRKLKPPFTALLVMAVSDAPIWQDVNSVTLSFGTKKLRLTPNANKSGTREGGGSVEAMTVRVPHRDFVALAKSGKFYITVGDASFAVNSQQAAGLRELARRISQ